MKQLNEKKLKEDLRFHYGWNNANFASSVCEFRLNRCEHIASPVYGYGSSV